MFVLDVGALVNAQKCAENSFYCKSCELSMWGKQDVQEHFETIHGQRSVDLFSKREFKNILLEAGNGHILENFNSNWLSDGINYHNFVEPLLMSTGKKMSYCNENSYPT